MKISTGIDDSLFLLESNKIEGIYDDASFIWAIEAWNYINKYKTLTVKRVLKTHAILMTQQDIRENEKGRFRMVPVWVGGREGKPWYILPHLVENWIRKVNRKRTEKQIKMDHIDFETIHPFIDGNGRMGRILMNWQRVRDGYPILIIREDKKQSYYEWFR